MGGDVFVIRKCGTCLEGSSETRVMAPGKVRPRVSQLLLLLLSLLLTSPHVRAP